MIGSVMLACSTVRRDWTTKATRRRTTSTRCSTRRTRLPERTPRLLEIRRKPVFSVRPGPLGPWPAPHIDHRAVAGGCIRVDETRHHHPSIERHDLAILLAAGRPRWADEVLTARAALDPQFGRLRLVGKMHDHAAGRTGIDDVRLLALVARRGFGSLLIVGLVE